MRNVLVLNVLLVIVASTETAIKIRGGKAKVASYMYVRNILTIYLRHQEFICMMCLIGYLKQIINCIN